MIRLYQPIPLAAQTIIQLDDRGRHYLGTVLRARVNDVLTVFNGEGGEYQAVITAIDKKNIIVQLIAFVSKEVESTLSIHLGQGIARGEKMDFIIQKAVELGVTEITPLLTERSNVSLQGPREAKRLRHWQEVVISACEQCGRNRIPIIHPITPLSQFISGSQEECRFLLSPHQVATNLQSNIPKSISLLIGPEGGLSSNEEQQALTHQFQALRLGPRILRTETAPLAALAVLQYAYGDYQND